MRKTRRFAVSAARIETAAAALDFMKKNDIFRELIQIQVSRGHELAGGKMLRPENPVFLLVGGKRC